MIPKAQRTLPLLLALFLLTALSAAAQVGTSRVTGTVTDSSGAVVAGATVTLKNEATGLTQTQQTTEAGLYVFASVPAGDYTVSVERAGFKTLQRTGNNVEADTPLAVDITLEAGQVTEVVTVQGGAEQLQTTNATIGNVVEQKAIEQLPLNGRNPLTLITIEPGVTQRSAGAGSNTISVNGSRDRAFNVTIDGIEANEASVPTATNNVYRINPDMIREYKVTTNNATAEEGRNSGASISVATRSGGNDFHGTAFYFFRNEALNSKEFYANAQGLNKRLVRLNQFGGELSGPIRREKTFFFASYQGNNILTTQPIDSSFGVPILYSPTALTGVFRYFIANPACNQTTGANCFRIGDSIITQNSPLLVNPQTGQLRAEVPVCGGAITSNCVASFNIFANDPRGRGLDPVVGAIFRSYPAPNTYAAVSNLIDGLNTGGYVWNPPSKFKGPAFSARIDHNLNQNNSVFGRFLFSDYNTLGGDPLNSRPQVFPGFPPLGEVFRRSSNLALSWRSVISPRVVNEFTAGYARFVFLFTQGEANPGFPDVPPFDFVNISEPFNNTPRTERALTTPQIINNLSVVNGAHFFRFGVNARFYRHVDRRGQPGGINVTPAITFAGSVRTPAGITNLPVTGTASRAGIGSTDNAFLLSSINALLGIPARIQQRFLGDLNADAFLPFTVGDEVTLQAVKHTMNQYNFYAQDEWKFRPNLTFNAGLRFEYNPAPSSGEKRTFVPGSPITGTPGPANPVVGDPGPVTFVESDSWYDRDNFTIGPRVGLAWSPDYKSGVLNSLFGASGRSVVRVGYGLAFDPIATFKVTSVSGSVPGLITTCTSTLTNTGTLGSVSPGCAAAPNTLRLGEGFPLQLAAPTTRPSSFLRLPVQLYTNSPNLVMFDQNIKQPTVHQWSLSFQRELPGGFVGQAAYVGRRGTRLFRSYDINQINADPLLPSFRIMQNNLNAGCTAAGASCPVGVTGTTVPLLAQLVAGGLTTAAATTFINNAAVATELRRNGAGAFAELVENQTLALKLRPNQQFARITYIDSGGNSAYHGAQFTLRRRFAQGLGLNMAYTFAKSMDDGSLDPVGAASGGNLSTTTARAAVDIRDYRQEWARSDFDRRHVFNVASVWELPVGKGQRFLGSSSGVVNHLLGGWSINTIFTAMSGEPFSVTSGVRTSNNAHVSRADVVAPVSARLRDVPTIFGPVLFTDEERRTAFRTPAPGANGAGRNIFTASPYWNVDFGFVKHFTLTERFRLQFRTEMFNAFNHANFDNPRDATVGSPSILSAVFGQACCSTVSPPSTQTIIQTGESGRVIQFALKLQF